jgi:hypothetical protein
MRTILRKFLGIREGLGGEEVIGYTHFGRPEYRDINDDLFDESVIESRDSIMAVISTNPRNGRVQRTMRVY